MGAGGSVATGKSEEVSSVFGDEPVCEPKDAAILVIQIQRASAMQKVKKAQEDLI